jgi:drug/metabolite transporter (DMT)-like permease
MTQLAARRSSIVAAFVAVCVIWGSTYFVLRLALEGFPPFLISAIRFLLAGGVLYTVLRLRGERAPTTREWGGAIVTGALFFVIGNGLVNVAEQSVSSGLVSVLVATMPLWVTLFQRLGGTVVTRREWTGIGLGLAGVVVLNLGSDLRSSGLGALCALAAPVGWALGSVGSARLPLPRGAMRTAAQMLAGGVATLLVSLALGERLPAAPTARPILAVLYLAIFGSLVGFSAYSFLLRHTRAAVATSYAYVNPVIALLLGLWLGGERVGLTSAIGSTITLGAVLLLTGAKARQVQVQVAIEEPRRPTEADDGVRAPARSTAA